MAETPTLRVAVVGAGAMANRVHYPSLASFDDVQIAAIAELDDARLQQTADRYQVPGRYHDYRQMVAEVAPDAVYVIGQPHLMYDIWTWCLSQGLNLYIEKPPGITLHQTRSLAHLAEQHGCITQVSFQRRCCPLAVKLYDACRQRGPITHALCRFYKCDPSPMTGARDHMMDDGVHAIDTLRWLCGGEVVAVDSVCRRVGTPDVNFIQATLHFDNGAVGVLLNSWTSGRRIFTVEMHAPGICAEADLEAAGRLFADGDVVGECFHTHEVSGSDEFYIHGGFQAKHREFIDAVRTRTQPSTPLSDALKTMTVAETILAQALLGGR